MSTSDHYFSQAPASADARRTIDVRIRGRDLTVSTAPGVFSHDHLDTGTRVLLEAVPPPAATGDLLDLGCGWGPIAFGLAAASPGARVWAVDVNDRALDLVRANAARIGAANIVAARPEELLRDHPDVRFAAVWSNPPIRVGKAALHELLTTWLTRLTDDGEAWLVVARNLGADSLQRWLTDDLRDAATGGAFVASRETSVRGFRVLRVSRA